MTDYTHRGNAPRGRIENDQPRFRSEMSEIGRPSGGTNDSFRFRVSDAVEIPKRGYLLRLRLLAGAPRISDFRPGREIVLRAPDGAERAVTVMDLAVTGGKPSQARLDRLRELDIVISLEDALADDQPVKIGWFVVGTGVGRGKRAA